MASLLCLGSIEVTVSLQFQKAVESWFQVPLNICPVIPADITNNEELVWAEVGVCCMLAQSSSRNVVAPLESLLLDFEETCLRYDCFGNELTREMLSAMNSARELERLRSEVTLKRWKLQGIDLDGTSKLPSLFQLEASTLKEMLWLGQIPKSHLVAVLMNLSGAAELRNAKGVDYYQRCLMPLIESEDEETAECSQHTSLDTLLENEKPYPKGTWLELAKYPPPAKKRESSKDGFEEYIPWPNEAKILEQDLGLTFDTYSDVNFGHHQHCRRSSCLSLSPAPKTITSCGSTGMLSTGSCGDGNENSDTGLFGAGSDPFDLEGEDEEENYWLTGEEDNTQTDDCSDDNSLFDDWVEVNCNWAPLELDPAAARQIELDLPRTLRPRPASPGPGPGPLGGHPPPREASTAGAAAAAAQQERAPPAAPGEAAAAAAAAAAEAAAGEAAARKGALRRALRAHALLNPRVGYCQGLNFIAALLLTEAGASEEDTAWLLYALTSVSAPCHYLPDLAGARAEALALAALARSGALPAALGARLRELGLPLELLYTQWLLTHFATALPPPAALRVLALRLAEGPEACEAAAAAPPPPSPADWGGGTGGGAGVPPPSPPPPRPPPPPPHAPGSVTAALALVALRGLAPALAAAGDAQELAGLCRAALAGAADADGPLCAARRLRTSPGWRTRWGRLRRAYRGAVKAERHGAAAAAAAAAAGGRAGGGGGEASSWGNLLVDRCTNAYTESLLLTEGRLAQSTFAPLMLRGLQWFMGWETVQM